MQLKNIIAKFIVMSFCDSKKTSPWYDNWLASGPLCKFISYRDLYASDFTKNEKVPDIISNGKWNIHVDWLDRFKVIFNQPPINMVSNKADGCMWKSKSGKMLTFSVKAIWNDLCDDWEDVKWAGLVWFSQCTSDTHLQLGLTYTTN
ncbi:uncharacterized protein [Rutidosis leptorrhynchoides]|uniref:uncharacterized protein n=1 Tax=Rutidosis leptorrhynchoides TaxID=125765 RepID=UPI003A991045